MIGVLFKINIINIPLRRNQLLILIFVYILYSRYFFLLEDGSLKGFKNLPDSTTSTEALNNFTVRGCQIMSVERPKRFSFIIRGLQLTTIIERMFSCNSEGTR